MVFSYPGTSSSSKSFCRSRRKRWPKFIAAARRKSRKNHHFLWVSEVTWGIFGVQFWSFSVLHCHGVFLSGDQQQQKPLQRQEEKVAKIHSSKKKKPPKSSFSIGFRSYVRYFRTAILGLLRPSLPWCFPTAMVFSYPGTSRRKR